MYGSFPYLLAIDSLDSLELDMTTTDCAKESEIGSRGERL